MELRDYIAIGTAKAGTLTKLGEVIGLTQQEMTNAKAHRRGLPSTALVKLQEFIGSDLKSMIAANELVTEKKAEKRSYWVKFLLTPTPLETSSGKGLAGDTICIMLNRLFKLKQCHLSGLIEKIIKSTLSGFTFRLAEPKPV